LAQGRFFRFDFGPADHILAQLGRFGPLENHNLFQHKELWNRPCDFNATWLPGARPGRFFRGQRSQNYCRQPRLNVSSFSGRRGFGFGGLRIFPRDVLDMSPRRVMV
jgi:hypothetical protein